MLRFLSDACGCCDTMHIAKRRGHQKAIVALARRLAVIMHRMWSDGAEFQWSKDHGLAKA
jgi:hypothetical protein